MGASVSRIEDAPAVLRLFAGPDKLTDEQWDQLLQLKIHVPSNRRELERQDHVATSLVAELARNNLWTRNLTELLMKSIELCDEWLGLQSDGSGEAAHLAHRLSCALQLSRYSVQHLVAELRFRAVMTQLEPDPATAQRVCTPSGRPSGEGDIADPTASLPARALNKDALERHTAASSDSRALEGDISTMSEMSQADSADAAEADNLELQDRQIHSPLPNPKHLVIDQRQPLVLSLVDALIAVIGTSFSASSLEVHHAAVGLLLILASPQLRSRRIVRNPILSQVAISGSRATMILHGLLQLMIDVKVESVRQHDHADEDDDDEESHIDVMHELMDIVSLPFQMARSVLGRGPDAPTLRRQLGNQTATAVLVLLLQRTGLRADGRPSLNRFAEAFANLQDTAHPKFDGLNDTSISVPFASLFEHLHRSLARPHFTLLFYTLVIHCHEFRKFAMQQASTEPDLFLTLLRIVYNASKHDDQQVHLLLVILLRLLQDQNFAIALNLQTVSNVNWYSERATGDISISSLAMVVLLRTLAYNLSTMRDLAIHDTVLACLANLSWVVQEPHTLACQRLTRASLSLGKQLLRLRSETEDNVTARGKGTEYSEIGQTLSRVLSVVANILQYQPRSSANLVYNLLVDQEHLDKLSVFPQLSSKLHTISSMLGPIRMHLDHPTNKHLRKSPSEVLSLIRHHLLKAQAVPQPDDYPPFAFQDNQSQSHFFLPYVWRVIVQHDMLFRPDPSLYPICTVEQDGEV